MLLQLEDCKPGTPAKRKFLDISRNSFRNIPKNVTDVSTGFLEYRILVTSLKSDPTKNALPATLEALPVTGGRLGNFNCLQGT